MPAEEQDVLRLDVAVDDAALVRVLERFGRLAGDAERVVQRELLLAVEPVPERLALDERHDVVEQPLGLARVVEAEDVGVLEGGGDADFAEEAVAAEQAESSGRSTLMATGRSCFRSLARKTVAIPPSPAWRSRA